MKVAYIVSIGKGLESFIFREIDELIKRGLKIVLYTTKFKKNDIFSPKPGWLIEKINLIKVTFGIIYWLVTSPVVFFKQILLGLNHNTIIEFIIACDYSLRMKKDKIEQIHCHFGDRKFFIGFFCKKLLNIKLTLTVHAHELYANPNIKFFKESLSGADKIVAISQKNKDILINDFNVNPKKIKVIRLSVDFSNFKSTKKIKILTVARYTERKGFNELFKAIKALKNLNLQFITVGFGELDLKKMAIENEILDKLIIYDKMDAKQLSFFYNNCDIFCLPSKTTLQEGAEGIPVVLMEAMSSELIIVTTNNGSISEIVDDIIVKENDVESLVDGLKKAVSLVKNGNRFIGKKNRKKVLSEYSDVNIDTLKKFLYE